MRVLYSAADGCPDHDAFVSQVLARSERIVSAAEGEAAREFRVTIVRRGEGFEGQLQSSLGTAETSGRSVPGTNCASVAQALALIVALSLDPKASSAPVAGFAKEDSATAAEPPPTAMSAPAAPAPTTTASPIVDAGPAPSAPEPAPSQPAWSMLLDVAVAAGVAPDPLVAPGLAVELEGASFLLRATLHGAVSGWFDEPVGRARFVWMAARGEGCAPRFGERLQLWPCAFVEAGTLYAAGSGTDDDRDAARVWLAPGLSGRLRWLPAGSWVIELQGGMSVPLFRQSYLLPAENGGENEVYTVPPVAGWAGVAGGLRFE